MWIALLELWVLIVNLNQMVRFEQVILIVLEVFIVIMSVSLGEWPFRSVHILSVVVQ